MSKLKKLPIGIQTFRTIREENYLYIDKTEMALDLIEGNQRIFLSRPRRFGKSLFLDTLKNIFEGNKELFKGLHIYEKYDLKKHLVIKIDWSGDVSSIEGTKERIMDVLRYNQESLGVKPRNK